MKSFTDRAAGALTAVVLGAALLAAPTLAASADTGAREMLAQATAPTASPAAPSASTPAAPATPAPRRARNTRAQTVDQRIATLHRQLKITPDQEPEWNAVAEAMRDNAKTLTDLEQQREQNAPTMTAIDDLKSYEQIADAHADGLRKLVPAFQALYDKMSDAQKKNADTVFERRSTRTPPKSG